MICISPDLIEGIVASKIPRNHPDFASVVSDVNLRLFKYRHHKNLAIPVIVKSVIIDNWRKKKAYDFSLDSFFYFPEESLNDIETVLVFESFLKTKPLKDQRILVGRALGYSFEDIAKLNKMTTQQCYKYYKNRYKRWLDELKLRLALF